MNKYVYMRHVSTVLISSDFELLIHIEHIRESKERWRSFKELAH